MAIVHTPDRRNQEGGSSLQRFWESDVTPKGLTLQKPRKIAKNRVQLSKSGLTLSEAAFVLDDTGS